MGPDRDFEPTRQKIDNFKHSYGTILYYEDQDVITGLQEKMPNFYDNFEIWSNQTNAMHQYAIWTAYVSKLAKKILNQLNLVSLLKNN